MNYEEAHDRILKLIGRELDKAVTAAAGYEEVTSPVKGYRRGGSFRVQLLRPSVDDSDAAKLRREMAGAAVTLHHSPTTGRVSVAFDTGSVTANGMERASIAGDTEGEATGRAYVLWKELQAADAK